MGFQRWLERLGFVRARDFGLILTPDRRLLTTRAVRDDGFGNKIVGWIDEDLMLSEPEPMTAIPQPMPEHHTEPIDERSIEHVAAAQPVALKPPWGPIPSHDEEPAPEEPEQPEQPDAPELGEDEWEWEIAAARARASSDSSETLPRLPLTSELPQLSARSSSDSLPQVIDPPVAAAASEPIVPFREPPPTDPNRPRTVIPVPTLPSGAVRTFEQPRFPRATSRNMAAVTPPRTSARR